jgi:hypothetical protein
MATFVFTDGFVSINAVDLSDHVKSVTLDYSAEPQDDSAMGDTTRSRTGGLKDWSVSVDFHQDYAAAKVDATLFSLVGTTTALIVRPDNSDGVSATNPNFTGTGLLESYNPAGGSLGEMAAATATFQAAGTLTRATT